MDKYILYTRDSRTEYDDFEAAKKAYTECPQNLKFLYQPDKNYFLGTVSATGYKVGHDHMYHKDTAKCHGLFIADNANQINNFLKRSKWRHQGTSCRNSIARLYGNGPYGSLYKINKNVDRAEWEDIERCIRLDYLSNSNINYTDVLNKNFGAIDVRTTERADNPYRLY